MSYRPESSTYGTEATTSKAPAAAPLEDAAADAPNEHIVIQGFAFDNCGAPGCDNMSPCPVHQQRACQEQLEQQRGWSNGNKRLGHDV